METKANYVAVGAFVLTCMLGLVIVLLWLSGMQYNQEFAYYQTEFHRPGDRPRQGHDGALQRHRRGPRGRRQIRSATIRKWSSPRCRSCPVSESARTSVVSIESEGLTGGSYVEISGGSKNAPLLTAKEGQRYPVIKSAPSTLQKLALGAPQLLEKLNNAADKINAVLTEKNQKAFADILANLDTTTGALARRSDDIDATIANLSRGIEDSAQHDRRRRRQREKIRPALDRQRRIRQGRGAGAVCRTARRYESVWS